MYKDFVDLFTILLLFIILASWPGHGCEILAPQPGNEPAPLHWKVKLRLLGLQGKFSYVSGFECDGTSGGLEGNLWARKKQATFWILRSTLPRQSAAMGRGLRMLEELPRRAGGSWKGGCLAMSREPMLVLGRVPGTQFSRLSGKRKGTVAWDGSGMLY